MTQRDDTEIDDIQASMSFGEPRIMSMHEIANLLHHQANMRSPENDDGGILQTLADQLNKWIDAPDTPDAGGGTY